MGSDGVSERDIGGTKNEDYIVRTPHLNPNTMGIHVSTV